MRSVRFACLPVFSSLTLLLLFAQPRTPAPQASGAGDLTLDINVTDKNGVQVRGLQPQDFTLLDDKHPVPLSSFRAVDVNAGTPAPYIEIVLVLDAINADVMTTTMGREGIKKFLLMNGGKLAQPASVVVVSDQPTQMRSKPSTDGNAQATFLDQYQTGLRTVNRTQGNFGVGERFQMSMNALSSLGAYEASTPGRKLILWISPGWPLLSAGASDITKTDQQRILRSIVALSTQLRQDHITLYNVETRGVDETSVAQFTDYEQFLTGVKSVNQAYPAALSLQVLSVQTGGRVFNESNGLPSAIAAEIERGAADGQAFYVVTIPSAQSDRVNEYHSLQIKLNKPGLTARTRTGYYAQP